MAVSVIVSNFNGERFLPRLLETLQAQKGVQAEVIVVDRHSRDRSRQLLAVHPDVAVCEEPPESGLVSGYASAVAQARHEHLFFCNEDMWFDEDCLQNLERNIDLADRVAVADPWQWTYDGKMWIHGGTRFGRCRWTLQSPYPFRAAQFTEALPVGSVVPFPCAGAFMIHRAVYEEVGGWDCSYFLDFEDVDLGVRLWQRGWRCVTVPEAKVYHAVNASNVKMLTSLNRPVSQRRYISGRASVCISGLKYFRGVGLLLPALTWLAMAVNNGRRLRFRRLWWDLLAAGEVVKRLRAALAYRRDHRSLNRACRGERFFLCEEFAQEPVEGRGVQPRPVPQFTSENVE
jgi:GT2 family glycosyltransferase